MGDYCKVHGRYTGNTCTACAITLANMVNAELASLRTQLAARTAEVERMRRSLNMIRRADMSACDGESARNWIVAEMDAALAPKEKTDG